MLSVTATDLPRLMACNGSRSMGDHKSPVEQDNTVRDEGNAADWFVQQVHGGHATPEELIDRKAPNGVYITIEMFEFLADYLKMKPGTLIEHDTSFGCDFWQVNSRADKIYYDPLTCHLYVDDLKYGWGIVEPEMHWALIAHALGYWTQHKGMNVTNITFTIYQPRPHHPDGRVRSWTIDSEYLIKLYDTLNNTLSNLTDDLNTGSHCNNCPAMTVCPARRNAEMNCIDASEKVFIDKIDDAGLSFKLDQLKRAIQVLTQQEKAYKDEALARMKNGKIINNYSLDQGLANRSWKKDITPEYIKSMSGKTVTKDQLITPNQAELLGVNKEFVASLTERRNKGVKVVRVDADTKARTMFSKTKEK